jgi:hypothetical protein
VDEGEAPAAVDALDVKTDTTVIFWSSGTTGFYFELHFMSGERRQIFSLKLA